MNASNFIGLRSLLIHPVELAARMAECERAKAAHGAQSGVVEYLQQLYGAPPEPKNIDGVAVIPIAGVISHGVTPLDKIFGMADVQEISDWIAEAEADPTVKSILLDINSPGGSVTGVPELGAQVAALSKPSVAFTNSQMASAAYWIGSQARRVVATPSASVGSVGVYMAFNDLSALYAQMGVRVDIIKSGEHKAAGYPGTALTEKQREGLQAQVTALHEQFKAAVTSRRTGAKAADMEGQSFYGADAAARGLVTAIVPSRAALIRAMQG